MENEIVLSIIIPVYNNANFTKLALEGLLKLTNSYEIIIVDNGSTDNTNELVNNFIKNAKETGPKILYIHSLKNRGFGAACNSGYKAASGTNVMFLNNDIRVEKDFKIWPNEMVYLANKGYIVCTLGGLLDNKFNFIKEGKHFKQNDYWYMSGWCICGSKQTFDKLILNYYRDEQEKIVEGRACGPWNERLFLYGEDVDLTWRAKKLNIPIQEVNIPVHHFSRVTGRKYNMFGYLKKSQKILKEMWKEKYK